MHEYRPLAFRAPLACCSIKDFATWETEGFYSAPTNIISYKNAHRAQLRLTTMFAQQTVLYFSPGSKGRQMEVQKNWAR